MPIMKKETISQPARRGRPLTKGTPKEKPVEKVGQSKRKRKRSTSSEDEGTSQERKTKLPKNTPFKPSQLFRKDLISAMKLPDSEHLSPEDYWLIGDPWRQEWEQPVQVPVCPDQLPSSNVRVLRPKLDLKFRLPKRYLCLSEEKAKGSKDFVQAAATQLHQVLSVFDLDELDIAWLDVFNKSMKAMGQEPLVEEDLEKAMYDFELQSHEIYQKRKKLEEGLGLEYDENVVCDICKSPDSYEHNEIVFCDACNISLHQYCYGILAIPEGTWLCQPCARGVRPTCMLCPNQGGALKLLKDGFRWVHVACAIWIPEVDIEKLDCMEPIGGIETIPEKRWSLQCSLCHIKEGACIQCSVKCCAVAYHVTCGYQHQLEMTYNLRSCLHSEASIFESFCLKHTKERKKPAARDNPPPTPAQEQHSFADRQQRIKILQERFYEGVSLEVTHHNTNISLNHLYFFFNYWMLKRRSNFNQALYSFTTNQRTLSHVQEDNTFQKIKICIRLRQDLERIRNLCYMVSRREKLFKSWIQVKKEVAYKQLDMVSSPSHLSEEDLNFITQASHGNSIYDMVYKFSSTDEKPQADLLPSLDEVNEKKRKGRRRKISFNLPPPSSLQTRANDKAVVEVEENPQQPNRTYRRSLKTAISDSSLQKSLGRRSTRSSDILPNHIPSSTNRLSDSSEIPKSPFNINNIKKNVPKIFKALQIFNNKHKKGRKRQFSESQMTSNTATFSLIDKPPSSPPPSECKTPASPKSPENPYAKHYLRQSIERSTKKFRLDSADAIKKGGKSNKVPEFHPPEVPMKYFRRCKQSSTRPTKDVKKSTPQHPVKEVCPLEGDDKCNKPPPPDDSTENPAKSILTNRLNRALPSSPKKVKKHELKENKEIKLGTLTIPCERIDFFNGILALDNKAVSRRRNFSYK